MLCLVAALGVFACGGKQLERAPSREREGGVPSGGSGGVAGTEDSGKGSGGVARVMGSGGSYMLARDFDRACEKDDDCALVTEGFQCACYRCTSNAAIRASEVERWNSQSVQRTCPIGKAPCYPLTDVPSGGCAAPAQAACRDGTCIAQRPRVVDDANYDRVCLTDADCVFALTGDICTRCPCRGGAVSRLGAEQLQADEALAGCASPRGGDCDCSPLTDVHCERPSPSPSGVCRPGLAH